MTDLIKSLLEEREHELKLKAEAKEKAKTDAVKAMLETLKTYLGGFSDLLEERYQKTGEKYSYSYETNNEDIPIRIHYQIPVMPEYELAPILIKWGSSRFSHEDRERFRVGGHYFATLKEAIAEARNKYPEYIEKAREDAFKEFDKAVPHAWHNGEVDLPKIEETLSALIKEWPELEDRARTYVSQWKKSRAGYEKQREEERVSKAREEAEAKIRAEKLETYVRALAAHLRNVEEIDKRNREIAEEIQARADRAPYTVYKLNYALVGSIVEDGEEFRDIETREVYTFDEEPEDGKYWNINGKKIRFLHAFSVEKEEVYPSSGILAKRITRSSIDLYFHPQDPEEFVSEELKKISPLPEGPEIPDEIRSHYDSRYLNRAAYALLEHEKETVEDALSQAEDPDFWVFKP